MYQSDVQPEHSEAHIFLVSLVQSFLSSFRQQVHKMYISVPEPRVLHDGFEPYQ